MSQASDLLSQVHGPPTKISDDMPTLETDVFETKDDCDEWETSAVEDEEINSVLNMSWTFNDLDTRRHKENEEADKVNNVDTPNLRRMFNPKLLPLNHTIQTLNKRRLEREKIISDEQEEESKKKYKTTPYDQKDYSESDLNRDISDFYFAIEVGDAKSVKEYLTMGIFDIAKDSKGNTPLMKAVECNRDEIFDILYDWVGNCNMSSHNHYGESLRDIIFKNIHFSTKYRHLLNYRPAVVAFLMSKTHAEKPSAIHSFYQDETFDYNLVKLISSFVIPTRNLRFL